jgi:hypothetical protein
MVWNAHRAWAEVMRIFTEVRGIRSYTKFAVTTSPLMWGMRALTSLADSSARVRVGVCKSLDTNLGTPLP